MPLTFPVTSINILLLIIIGAVIILGQQKRWREVYEILKYILKYGNHFDILAARLHGRGFLIRVSVIMVRKSDEKKALNLLKELEKENY